MGLISRGLTVCVALAALSGIARAHTPIFVVVDSTVTPARLALAPGSIDFLKSQTVTLMFSPLSPPNVYSGLFIEDEPGYDATLFPFSTNPGVMLRLERVYFDTGLGMFQSVGSTTEILTADGQLRSFTGHTHFVHHVDSPGVYRAHFRYVDASGQLVASNVFTVTFRASRPGGDADMDGDADAFDNCVDDANADQSDVDADSIGDVCDLCPLDADRFQLDLNDDGFGDACNCAGEPCAEGDVNYDGEVDLLDLIEARNRFSPNQFPPAPPQWLRCEISGDGQIDTEDLVEIRNLLP